jgi:uncharacterized iron-regulated membrane protein
MSGPPAFRTANAWSRSIHRWGAILVALPLLLVIGSGLLLQLKKQIPWVQPPTLRGSEGAPTLSFAEILAAAASVPETEIRSWGDVSRLDVQPARGMVKVQAKNHWEVQIDTATGEILQVKYRRSDLIESLHDGSFFGDRVKLAVFLPAGIVLFLLWVSGIYLWFLPSLARRFAVRRRKEIDAARGG